MSQRLPAIPPRTLDIRNTGDITNSARIGTPPVGRGQWFELAQANNWLLGGGCMQLGWWGPTAILGGATGVFHTYAWPRPQCFARLWSFVIQGRNVTGAVATADVPSGVAFATGPNDEFYYVDIPELVSDTTPTGEAISVSMAISSTATAAIIHSASCIELPLKVAANSGDPDGLGIQDSTLRKWHAIAELDESAPSTTDQESVTGVMRVASEVIAGDSAARRAKIFDWHLTTGLTISSSTFTNMLRLNPTCQTRHLHAGETSRTCRWAVYAAASASAGEVRLTSSITGGTSTISVNSAVPAWYSSTIAVATDDMSSAGWIRGSRETVTVERRATSGNITVYGVCIGERGV